MNISLKGKKIESEDTPMKQKPRNNSMTNAEKYSSISINDREDTSMTISELLCEEKLAEKNQKFLQAKSNVASINKASGKNIGEVVL